MTASATPRYDYIDALRGLAIAGVVLVHTSDVARPYHYIAQLISQNGQLGVQLFFIASAITLFLSLESKSKVEAKPVRNFFIRRFFRIAPMFYIGTVLYLLLNGFGPIYSAPNGIKWWFIPLTLSFMHGWHPETINSVVPGGWSIAVEFSFYLTVPFLFSKLKNVKSSLVFILVTLLLGKILSVVAVYMISPLYPNTHYLVEDFTYLWFFSQLPVFGIGILVYNIIKEYRFKKDYALGMILFLIVLFLSVAFLVNSSYQDLFPARIIYGVIFGLLTLALHFGKIPVVNNIVFQWIGKLSFSIYILHPAVLILFKSLFSNGFPISGDLGTITLSVVTLIISSALSFLTYFFIETPGIKLGKKLIEKLERSEKKTELIDQPLV